jgi:phosphoglycerate dehydrogenase-like enzyme
MTTIKFKCLAIASPSFAKHPTLVTEARDIAEQVVINSDGTRFDEGQLLKFLSQPHADAVIIGTDPLTKSVISQLPHLKAIGKYGVGLDNVDLNALDHHSIYLAWQPGVNRRSVAELTLGFMIGHMRNVFRSICDMQHGHWVKNGGMQLSEKSVGIVGFGHIGTDVARLLQPFNCKLLIHDILNKQSQCHEFKATQVSYEKLLQASDIVTFHVPGGTATRNMFSSREIKLVKTTALIINTARGSIIDFPAVTKALRDENIGGYASDVFPHEPFISEDYLVKDGFYFTPHIGGNAEEAVLDMGRSAIEGLKQYLKRASKVPP